MSLEKHAPNDKEVRGEDVIDGFGFAELWGEKTRLEVGDQEAERIFKEAEWAPVFREGNLLQREALIQDKLVGFIEDPRRFTHSVDRTNIEYSLVPAAQLARWEEKSREAGHGEMDSEFTLRFPENSRRFAAAILEQRKNPDDVDDIQAMDMLRRQGHLSVIGGVLNLWQFVNKGKSLYDADHIPDLTVPGLLSQLGMSRKFLTAVVQERPDAVGTDERERSAEGYLVGRLRTFFEREGDDPVRVTPEALKGFQEGGRMDRLTPEEDAWFGAELERHRQAYAAARARVEAENPAENGERSWEHEDRVTMGLRRSPEYRAAAQSLNGFVRGKMVEKFRSDYGIDESDLETIPVAAAGLALRVEAFRRRGAAAPGN